MLSPSDNHAIDDTLPSGIVDEAIRSRVLDDVGSNLNILIRVVSEPPRARYVVVPLTSHAVVSTFPAIAVDVVRVNSSGDVAAPLVSHMP